MLLRLGLGGAAVAQGVSAAIAVAGPADVRWWAVLLVLGGALLMLGFLTPVAAAGLTLLHGGAAAGWISAADGGSALPGAWLPPIVSAAVLLLGPGAFALDARLFGRREIRIARSRR
ncbi:MAG: hypothetical protein ABIX28_02415 [Vicinamibacterales bacterium]